MNSPELAPQSPPGSPPTLGQQTAAWLVHAYTASGLVFAAWMAIWIVDGGDRALVGVFVLMLIATVVDATDGMLARWARVSEVVPQFDGRRLDDLIDFLNYTCLPLLVIWRAELMPPHYAAVLLVPLLASAYGFCQTDAKTEDGYFLGFPSYWNIVAFYLYVLPLPPWLVVVVVIVFALLTFVPLRYLYPSQPGPLNRLTCLLGVIWAILLVVILVGLLQAGRAPSGWVECSLVFPLYYLASSWWLNLRGPRP